MPHIEFTSQLAKHVDCPAGQSVDAASLNEALELVFARHPGLREFVLDDQGAILQHLAVFIDGEMVGQRDQLNVPVSANSEIFVMQALSGG